jgi:hypothetical protein
MPPRYTTEAIEPISPSRKIQEPLEGLPPPIAQPILTHVADELKPSTQIPTTQLLAERPRLIPPNDPISRGLSERRFLQEMQKVKDRSNAITETVAKRLDIYKEEMMKLNDENIAKIKESAERAATSNWWSMLKKAATALLSALSLALGLSVIAGGGSLVIGGALVASGILSITNFVCSEAGIWDELAKKLAHNDEERRKKIGLIIPIALGVVSAALGLFGGVQSMAFTTNLAMAVLQTALSTFQGVTAIGLGISKGNLIRSQADIVNVRAAMDATRLNTQLVTQWIENFRSEMEYIGKRSGQVARMVIQANQKIVEG